VPAVRSKSRAKEGNGLAVQENPRCPPWANGDYGNFASRYDWSRYTDCAALAEKRS